MLSANTNIYLSFLDSSLDYSNLLVAHVFNVNHNFLY